MLANALYALFALSTTVLADPELFPRQAPTPLDPIGIIIHDLKNTLPNSCVNPANTLITVGNDPQARRQNSVIYIFQYQTPPPRQCQLRFALGGPGAVVRPLPGRLAIYRQSTASPNCGGMSNNRGPQVGVIEIRAPTGVFMSNTFACGAVQNEGFELVALPEPNAQVTYNQNPAGGFGLKLQAM